MSPLPLTCAHGNYWPSLCEDCIKMGAAPAPRCTCDCHKRKPKTRSARYQRRPALPPPPPPPDPDLEAFDAFLAEKWPDLDGRARANAYLTTPAARAEWEKTKDDRTSQPLF